MKRNGTERKYDVNGLDRCLVSFVPASFIGSSGGGIAQVVHRSAIEQVVTLTAGVTVINLHESMEPDRDQTRDSLTLPTALHGFCRADF